MPTENEFKFVLELDTDRRLDVDGQCLFLDQAYLNEDGSARIRRISSSSESGVSLNHFFTYKQMCYGRLVEIETLIDIRDFNDLWSQSNRKLQKTRFIPNGYDGWCIDFFCRWGTGEVGDRFFVMAEVELTEGEQPDTIPSFITNNLVYAVPQSDDRFTSSKLFDRKYATWLYESLKRSQTQA